MSAVRKAVRDELWSAQVARRESSLHLRHVDAQAHWSAHVEPWLATLSSRGSRDSSLTENRLRSARREAQREATLKKKSHSKDVAALTKLVKDVRFLFERQLGELNLVGEKRVAVKAAERRFDELVDEAYSAPQASGQWKQIYADIRMAHKNLLRDLFLEMDADGSGVLDQEELRVLALKLGTKLRDSDLAAAMAEMDEDGGGSVDFLEFFAWWTNDEPKSLLTKVSA